MDKTKVLKCKTCEKILEHRKSFCCRSCQGKYFAKYKIGCFNPKHLGKGGVKGGKATPKMLAAQRKMQELGIGMYAPGMASQAGKIGGPASQKTLKRLGIAFYNDKKRYKACKLGVIVCRKKKLNCFFNAELRKKMGQRAFKVILERNNFFRGIQFDSRGEMEIAMCLYYQHKIIMKKGINYQKKVGKSYCDFFINDIFIEFHPGSGWFYGTQKDYYNKRRKNLNKFGYREYPLIILK
jgi:hypothetical protein